MSFTDLEKILMGVVVWLLWITFAIAYDHRLHLRTRDPKHFTGNIAIIAYGLLPLILAAAALSGGYQWLRSLVCTHTSLDGVNSKWVLNTESAMLRYCKDSIKPHEQLMFRPSSHHYWKYVMVVLQEDGYSRKVGDITKLPKWGVVAGDVTVKLPIPADSDLSAVAAALDKLKSRNLPVPIRMEYQHPGQLHDMLRIDAAEVAGHVSGLKLQGEQVVGTFKAQGPKAGLFAPEEMEFGIRALRDQEGKIDIICWDVVSTK